MRSTQESTQNGERLHLFQKWGASPSIVRRQAQISKARKHIHSSTQTNTDETSLDKRKKAVPCFGTSWAVKESSNAPSGF